MVDYPDASDRNTGRPRPQQFTTPLRMTEVKSIITKFKVDSVHRIIQNSQQKFLCFTRLSEADKTWHWVIVVTNGVDVWKNEYDEEALVAESDLAAVSSVDAFLTRFRNGFTAGELSVAHIGTKLTLTVGKGSSTIGLDLFEPQAAEKKTELQTVLFHLAEQTLQLGERLSATQDSLEKMRTQKGTTSGLNLLTDFSSKKGQPKAKPRKVGMSVVNPASRKRKVATGVIYD